jgi:hypothetical protein
VIDVVYEQIRWRLEYKPMHPTGNGSALFRVPAVREGVKPVFCSNGVPFMPAQPVIGIGVNDGAETASKANSAEGIAAAEPAVQQQYRQKWCY